MGESFTLLAAVVVLALLFDYINGFHDTANAIATVVSTGVLPPRTAVLLAACFNFGGAFFIGQGGVAETIGKDITDPASITQAVVIAALGGAIIWNLITWYFGIPSSSSHALVGGLLGAVLCHRVLDQQQEFSGTFLTLVTSPGVIKVVEALVLSPIIGLLMGFIIMTVLLFFTRRAAPYKVNRLFRRLQIFSSCFLALSHGSNDAQKTMGVITMALIGYYGKSAGHAEWAIPTWVIVACAAAMALGTSAGGWRIMKTMGHKIIKLKPINGFAAESAGSIVILAATHLHAPVSTTHVISSAIMGVGASNRVSAVRWGIAGNIFMAWVLTIPVSALVAALCYLGIRAL